MTEPIARTTHTETHLHPTTSVIADTETKRRISWGAIIAGVFIALVVQLLLSLLGLGIGLSTINPTSEDGNPASGLGVGAAIWWLLSMLLALFAGGWTAGRLAGVPRVKDGTLHGLLTFSVVTLLTFYLLTTAVGRLISGASGIIGQGLSLGGQAVANAAPGIADTVKAKAQEQGFDLSNLQQEAETLLRQTGKPGLQPEALQGQAQDAANQAQAAGSAAAQNPQGAEMTGKSLIDSLFGQAKGTAGQVDREAAINVLVQRTGKSREEAGQIVDKWTATAQQARATFEQKKEEAKVKAADVGEKAASGLSKAALLAFFGLALGGAAAAFGGGKGTPQPLLRETTAVVR